MDPSTAPPLRSYHSHDKYSVIKEPTGAPPLPVIPPPDDLHLALAKLARFILRAGNLFRTSFEDLFPDTTVTIDVAHVPHHEHGAQQGLVAAPPLPAPVAPGPAVEIFPGHRQRRLVALISACCAMIIWLSSLFGPANLPVVPVDLALDLPGVLDVVNHPIGHVSGNVAVASPGVCLLKVGLKLVEIACEAS